MMEKRYRNKIAIQLDQGGKKQLGSDDGKKDTGTKLQFSSIKGEKNQLGSDDGKKIPEQNCNCLLYTSPSPRDS